MTELIEPIAPEPPAEPATLEGQGNRDPHSMGALEDGCAALQELQTRRKAYIQHVGAAERRLTALARRMMGWRWDMPEAERTKLNAHAARVTKALLTGKPLAEEDEAMAHQTGLAFDVALVQESIEPLADGRKHVEKEMEKIAADLPAAWLVHDTRGFGMRGLAVIVGEAGNLGDYANPAKLWKRLGLAPYNGRACSTWRMKGGLKSEEWSELGYSPGRLGQIHGVVTEPLSKSNDGKYRALYLAEKARFIAEGKSARPLHAHRHGMRLMTKELVLDCWRAWRGLPPRDRAKLHAPAHAAE